MDRKSRLFIGLLLTLPAVLIGFKASALAAIPAQERAALIALYTATDGDRWTNNSGWKTPPLAADGFALPGTESTWNGVITSGEHVSRVDLHGNNLVGAIPPQLGNLVNLDYLLLDENQLSGLIPKELGNLTNLQSLSLRVNILSGPIPKELGNLTELAVLSLGSNQLSGAIPNEFGNLTHLTYLDLWSNQLSGPIPKELGNLTNLLELSLTQNQLSGPIPQELGNLTELAGLYLGSNQLSGSIPKELSYLHNLIDIYLSSNQLSGPIPKELGDLTSLKKLFLNANQLSGPIPKELGKLNSLERLILWVNQLSGPIPKELGGLTNLTHLRLDSNQLSGPIPSELGNLTSLTYLFLNYNQLSGPIPKELGNLTELKELYLSSNQLSSQIPKELGNLVKLQILTLGYNQLSDPIPIELGQLTSLQRLLMESNQLSSQIPKELGNLVNLTSLWLEGNQLSGPIPQELGNLTGLIELTLSYNQLSGPIPKGICNLANLQAFYFNDNALTAPDPEVDAFLSAKSPGWKSYQTVCPEGFSLQGASDGVAKLVWTPSGVMAPGRFEIWRAFSQGGLFELLATTPDKNTTSLLVALMPGQTIYFKIRTITDPNSLNQNKVASDFSEPVSVTSPSSPTKLVTIYTDANRHGDIYLSTPSQVLPASALTFRVPPGDFPDATLADPVVVRLALPGAARLSQTLATGNAATAAPDPTAGERVLDLAVVEYALGIDGRPAPITGSALTGISARAVQLLRYVAGENEILVRINESTSGWAPRNGGAFLGFTIGLAAGVWPATDASNWGAAGQGRQTSTLFCGDMRQYEFNSAKEFPVTVCAYRQVSGVLSPAAFTNDGLKLFTVDNERADAIPLSYALGTPVKGFTLADVDGDGIEDLVLIAEGEKRLYWSLGSGGGGFHGIYWKELSGDYPQAVNSGDLMGHSKPDIVVGDASGNVSVYAWDNVFTKGTVYGKMEAAELRVAAGGEPAAAVVADVNGDGINDYVYCDRTGNTLRLLLGPGLTTGSTLATGAEPVALALGDLDGDGWPDVLTANRSGNSVSVFWNNGGSFQRQDIATVGSQPIAVAAGDFNRDGLWDVAVALAGNKAVKRILAQPGRALEVAGAQAVPLDPHIPSALMVDNFDGVNGADALVGFNDYSKLALLVSDTTGQLTHSANIDTLGDVATVPGGQGVTLAADQVVAVASGTSAGGMVSQQGAAVVQNLGVNVIHFPRSKDLSFSVVNLETRPAILNLELYNDAGGKPEALAAQTIAAGTQYAHYPKELLGGAADQAGRWVRAFLTQTVTHGMWLVNDPSLTYLDGMKLPEAVDALTRLVFPEVRTATDKTTTVILINPNREAASVTVSARNASGTAQGSKAYYLAGRSRKELDAGTEFPGLGDTGLIEVTADRGLLGTSLIADGGEVSCLGALPREAAGGVLYSPHVAVGNLGGVVFHSELAVVNTAAAAASLDLTLCSDDGTVVQTLSGVSIPAHGKLAGDVGTLLGLSTPVSGYLMVDPKGAAGVVGSVTFGGTAGKRFLSSLPLQVQRSRKFLLGHIAIGNIGGTEFFTGLAVLSPEAGAEARVQVTAYSAAGQMLDSRFLRLKVPDGNCPACRLRQVFMLDDFMPGLTDIFGGYVVVENLSTTKGILVFELFGDASLHFLSAVPAVPIE